MTRPEAVALLQAIRDAMSSREGRALAREIAAELRRADDEAAERDPVGADVDETIARARRADRRRGGDR